MDFGLGNTHKHEMDLETFQFLRELVFLLVNNGNKIRFRIYIGSCVL